MDNEKKCYIGIVEYFVKELINAKKNFDKTNIIIRSTIPPGTTNNLNCYFIVNT